jgi:hypothetical protein
MTPPSDASLHAVGDRFRVMGITEREIGNGSSPPTRRFNGVVSNDAKGAEAAFPLLKLSIG